MTEVNFASDEVWRWLPLMLGCVAFFELRLLIDIGITTGEPREVALGVIDHLFGEVGAINRVAHEASLLKNDAGAAERVEKATFFCALGGEVDKNLSELWRKHADEGIAGRASLVALGIGGNILSADRGGELVAKLDKFDMVELFAELVVMRGGARNSGGFAGDEADVATMTFQEVLIL